jgi:hypothetical protein
LAWLLRKESHGMEFSKGAYTMLQGDLAIPLEASHFQFLIAIKHNNLSDRKEELP